MSLVKCVDCNDVNYCEGGLEEGAEHKSCDAGQLSFMPRSAKTDCGYKECSAGTYYLLDSKSCKTCEANTYCALDNASPKYLFNVSYISSLVSSIVTFLL